MRIWLVTVGEPLPIHEQDVRLWRTGMLARLLAERGHEVTWWTSRVDHFTKKYHEIAAPVLDVEPGLQLRFMEGILYRRNVSLARLRNHIQIARDFSSQAEALPRPDIVLCSLPTIELSRAAVRFGLHAGVPVLLDIRDLWPDEIEARFTRRWKWLASLLVSPMTRGVRMSTRKATGLLAISEAYLDWGLKHAGRARQPCDRVFFHGYPDPGDTPRVEAAAEDWLTSLGIPDAARVFLYVGSFIGNIDLSTVIEAAYGLRNDPSVAFVFAGAGEKEAAWRREAAGLDSIFFTGWIGRDKVTALASRAYAGIAAYRAGALMSITNKISDYLSFGLPVISSLAGESRTLLEGHDCGLSYEPGNAHDLKAKLMELAAAPDRRKQMAHNARQLFKKCFSADVVYLAMARHLEHEASCGTS